jgi:membrane protease YdiL (CAAX protease family)
MTRADRAGRPAVQTDVGIITPSPGPPLEADFRRDEDLLDRGRNRGSFRSITVFERSAEDIPRFILDPNRGDSQSQVMNPQVLPPSKGVLHWAVLVFGLTGVGVVPLFLFVPDLSRFTGNLPPAKLALLGVGVELTAFAPSVAAVLVAWRLPGAGGARMVFGQVKRWRIHPLWYAVALLGPIPLLLTGNLIWLILGKPSMVWFAAPSGLAVLGTIGTVAVGSLGEEFGWRGFAQPRLQQRVGALWSALIVGTLWSTWHLWPVIVPGGMKLFLPSDLIQTFVRLMATAVIYAWIYNSTNGSLLAVMIAHAGHNIWTAFIPGPPDDPAHVSPIIGAALYALVALVVVAFTNWHTLTRNRGPETSLPSPDHLSGA